MDMITIMPGLINSGYSLGSSHIMRSSLERKIGGKSRKNNTGARPHVYNAHVLPASPWWPAKSTRANLLSASYPYAPRCLLFAYARCICCCS